MSARVRSTARFALVAVALALALEPLVVGVGGTRAAAWSHFWCSPAALRGTPNAGSGLRGALRVLSVHWPHFLPILLGLGTLVYLWRANARHHASGGSVAQTGSGAAGVAAFAPK